MISNKKIALIHVAKNELGLNDDEYRDILFREAGVYSSVDLDYEGFEAVIDCFNKMGFESTAKRAAKNSRRSQTANNTSGNTVTPAQQEYIKDLYNKLGWHKTERRTGFNRRQIGKPWAQTKEEASQVIEGLKAMLERND
ncbi:hypothetical protein JCM16358_22960 [Halanaerocella petrolearia]